MHMSPPKHHQHLSSATPPEKSKFLQTCNRLSLFLKERGKIRNPINAKFDATGNGLFESVRSLNHPNSTTTVDLLSTIGEKLEKPAEADVVIPEYVILDSIEIEDKFSSSAQMTIFYQGQVLVLDDVPADRARDLMMLMAKKKKGVNETSKPVAVAVADDVSRSKEKDSDLPIARRASLHKFLAKRAATVRAAPYTYHSPSPGTSSSHSGNQQTFDLNF